MFATRRIQIGVAALVVGMTLTGGRSGGRERAGAAGAPDPQPGDERQVQPRRAERGAGSPRRAQPAESVGASRELGAATNKAAALHALALRGQAMNAHYQLGSYAVVRQSLEQLRLGRRDGRRLGGLRPLPDRRRNRRRRPAVPRRAAHTGLGRRASQGGTGERACVRGPSRFSVSRHRHAGSKAGNPWVTHSSERSSLDRSCPIDLLTGSGVSKKGMEWRQFLLREISGGWSAKGWEYCSRPPLWCLACSARSVSS